MKQLVTAFVVAFVSLFDYSSTTNDCHHDLPPGLRVSNKGWYIADPVLYLQFWSDPDLNNGWNDLIYLHTFTCEENKMWNHSSKYKVPDQVLKIKPIEGVAIRNVTAFGLFSEENKRWTAKQVGLDYDSVKYGFASGSSSFGPSKLQNILLNNLMVIEASLTVHLYNVTMNSTKFELSDTFNEYCNFSKANKTLQDYGEIMDVCGTHYFESVILGGRLWFRVYVSMDAYKADPDNMKQLAVDELERYFRINTTQSGKIEFPGEIGREYFQLGTSQQKYHPLLCNENLCNYSYWLKHLPEEPYIVGGQMKPISDLTADKQDESQFENAIKLKLAGDYINELIEFLYTIQLDDRQNLQCVLGYYEVFGNWESMQWQTQKWEIPIPELFQAYSFINATDDELEFVGKKTKKIYEFRHIVGDNYHHWPCDHYMSGILDQCIEAVQHKWKSLNALQLTEPCCALYDLWNCALQSNCSVCAHDQMDKYQAFMVDAVSKSLCSTVPYHKYDQLCILHDNYTKVDFNLICPAKPITEPFRSYPTFPKVVANFSTITSKGTTTWLIVLFVLNILLIIVIICTILYIVYYYLWIFKPRKVSLVSQEKVEDT